MNPSNDNLNGVRRRPTRARPEQGWVLIATLIMSALAASLTVAWARHAVLAKTSLEMSTGASETEEAARSGLERTREQMRRGTPPGTAEDGEEQIVETQTGEVVTCEREVVGHDRRDLRMRAESPGDQYEHEATLKGRAAIVPGSCGHSDSSGKRTCLSEDVGSEVLMAGHLTVLSGNCEMRDGEYAGLYLLEEGAELTLENCVLRGTIITRPAAQHDHPLASGANRPQVNIEGNVRLLAGTDLPEVSICAPDAVVRSSNTSRCEAEGVVSADEVEVDGRACFQHMVVCETVEDFGDDCVRPGHGRGARDWPDCLEAGIERVTAISFPATGFTDDELDLLDQFDATDYL